MSGPRQDLTPRLLTIEQVAEHLGVTVRHVRRLVLERRIPYVKWGHLLRFESDAVARFVSEHTVRPIEARRRPTAS